jgi:hypothetical protein
MLPTEYLPHSGLSPALALTPIAMLVLSSSEDDIVAPIVGVYKEPNPDVPVFIRTKGLGADEVPDEPDVPLEPEVPDEPDVPLEPEVPDEPDVPADPKASIASKESFILVLATKPVSPLFMCVKLIFYIFFLVNPVFCVNPFFRVIPYT